MMEIDERPDHINTNIENPDTLKLSNVLLKLETVCECSCTVSHKLLPQSKTSDGYVFLQIMKGACIINIGENRITLQEKECLFTVYHDEIDVEPVNHRCRVSGVVFSGFTVPVYYNEYISCGGKFYFKPLCSTQYENTLDQIKTAQKTESCVQDMQINVYLYELLTALIYEARSAQSHIDDNRKRSDMQVVREYLEQHYKEKVTLEILEKNFYFSRFYISSAFHEQFGMNVTEYLNHVRIEEAKRLLVKTDNKIEAVAYQSGFGSSSFFWRIFKATTGISPSAYRTAHRNK